MDILWAAKYRKCLPFQILARVHTLGPGFILWAQGFCNRHSQHSNICVYCPDQYVQMTTECSMVCMQQHATISLFMVAWGERIRIMQRRLAQNGVITSCFPCWLNASNRALDKKWKSSVLFLSTRRKSRQFPGMPPPPPSHYTPAHSFSMLCS